MALVACEQRLERGEVEIGRWPGNHAEATWLRWGGGSRGREEVGCWLSLTVEPRGTFDELESIPLPQSPSGAAGLKGSLRPL